MADWFAPQRYGYGSGPPIAWQGWAVLIGYIALVGLASFILPYSGSAFAAIVVTLTAFLLMVAARTTIGGWRWRWDREDKQR